MDMFDKLKGGTELMYGELMKRLALNYQEEFSIFNYLPYEVQIKVLVSVSS